MLLLRFVLCCSYPVLSISCCVTGYLQCFGLVSVIIMTSDLISSTLHFSSAILFVKVSALVYIHVNVDFKITGACIFTGVQSILSTVSSSSFFFRIVLITSCPGGGGGGLTGTWSFQTPSLSVSSLSPSWLPVLPSALVWNNVPIQYFWIYLLHPSVLLISAVSSSWSLQIPAIQAWIVPLPYLLCLPLPTLRSS